LTRCAGCELFLRPSAASSVATLMTCLKSRVLCALLISPVSGASSLDGNRAVRPAEFTFGVSLGLLDPFPRGSFSYAYEPVYNCDYALNTSTCSRTEDFDDLTWPVKTYKIDGGPDAYSPFLDGLRATHGFNRYQAGPILPVDAVHFAIGAGFTTSRKRVENVTALKLSALAKSTLQNSVSDFLTRYGGYFISEITSGVSASCVHSYSYYVTDPDGLASGPSASLSSKLENITEDLFFDKEMEAPTMQPGFLPGVGRRNAYCTSRGSWPGSYPGIYPWDPATAIGQYFLLLNRSWTNTSAVRSSERKYSVQRHADVAEVREILASKEAGERALFELPVLSVEVSDALAGALAKVDWTRRAAEYNLYEASCASVNQTLRDSLRDIKWTNFPLRLGLMDSAAWGAVQDDLDRTGTCAWQREADALYESFQSIMQYCPLPPPAPPTPAPPGVPPAPPVAPVVDGGSCSIGCIVGIAAAVFVGLLLLLACALLFRFKKAGENGSGIKPGTTQTGSAAESA